MAVIDLVVVVHVLLRVMLSMGVWNESVMCTWLAGRLIRVNVGLLVTMDSSSVVLVIAAVSGLPLSTLH